MSTLGPSWRDAAGDQSGVSPQRFGSARVPLPDTEAAPITIEGLGPAPEIQLITTSTKSLKKEAAKAFLQSRIIKNARLQPRAFKCDSTVPEQPFGRAEGAQGAFGRTKDPRVQSALNAPEHCTIVVSFENCISFEKLALHQMPAAWRATYEAAYTNEEGLTPIDLAAIYVEVAMGAQRASARAWSDGVLLPWRFIDRNNQERTAGHAIAAETGLAHDDWQSGFCGFSRRALLQSGTARIALRLLP